MYLEPLLGISRSYAFNDTYSTNVFDINLFVVNITSEYKYLISWLIIISNDSVHTNLIAGLQRTI